MCSDNYRDDNVLMWECVYHIKKKDKACLVSIITIISNWHIGSLINWHINKLAHWHIKKLAH